MMYELIQRFLEEDHVLRSERNNNFGFGNVNFGFKVPLIHTRSDVNNAVQCERAQMKNSVSLSV